MTKEEAEANYYRILAAYNEAVSIMNDGQSEPGVESKSDAQAYDDAHALYWALYDAAKTAASFDTGEVMP